MNRRIAEIMKEVENIDDIDNVPLEPDVCETKTPHDHLLMFKALENPIRRKIVKSIGVFGKTKKEIMDEVNITEDQLKFQLDYLIANCYVEIEGENCKLNAKGIDELLINV